MITVNKKLSRITAIFLLIQFCCFLFLIQLPVFHNLIVDLYENVILTSCFAGSNKSAKQNTTLQNSTSFEDISNMYCFVSSARDNTITYNIVSRLDFNSFQTFLWDTENYSSELYSHIYGRAPPQV